MLRDPLEKWTYSQKEKSLFETLGCDIKPELSAHDNYRALALKCFVNGKRGVLVESVRKILAHFNTNTCADYDELITFHEQFDLSDQPISFNSTLLVIESKNRLPCLKAMQDKLPLSSNDTLFDKLIGFYKPQDGLNHEFYKWGFVSLAVEGMFFLNCFNKQYIKLDYHTMFQVIAPFVTSGCLAFQSHRGPNEIYSWKYTFKNGKVYFTRYEQMEGSEVELSQLK